MTLHGYIYPAENFPGLSPGWWAGENSPLSKWSHLRRSVRIAHCAVAVTWVQASPIKDSPRSTEITGGGRFTALLQATFEGGGRMRSGPPARHARNTPTDGVMGGSPRVHHKTATSHFPQPTSLIAQNEGVANAAFNTGSPSRWETSRRS